MHINALMKVFGESHDKEKMNYETFSSIYFNTINEKKIQDNDSLYDVIMNLR